MTVQYCTWNWSLFTDCMTSFPLINNDSLASMRKPRSIWKNYDNMRFSQSDAKIRLALYQIRISCPFRSPFWNWRFSSELFHLCGAPRISSKILYDYLKKLIWKESVQSLSLINCINIGLRFWLYTTLFSIIITLYYFKSYFSLFCSIFYVIF